MSIRSLFASEDSCDISVSISNMPSLDTIDFVLIFLCLSPGQMDSQVEASRKLGSTCDSVWPGLACTCGDLPSLALTLVEIKFAGKLKQVFLCLATQPNSTQVE